MAPLQALVQPMAIKPKTKNNDLHDEVEITQSRMAYKSIHGIMPQLSKTQFYNLNTKGKIEIATA